MSGYEAVTSNTLNSCVDKQICDEISARNYIINVRADGVNVFRLKEQRWGVFGALMCVYRSSYEPCVRERTSVHASVSTSPCVWLFPVLLYQKLLLHSVPRLL